MDEINQLTQYIIALTHLYGIVHKDKIREIYNSQNADPILLCDVEEIIGDPPDELENYCMTTYKEYFIRNTILETNNVHNLLRKKGNKPYYVPDKEELLRYVDEWYFEKNKRYEALVNFAKKNYYKNEEKAEDLCEELYDVCKRREGLPGVIQCLSSRKLSFRNTDQLDEMSWLLMMLTYNLRKWEHNGHTPQEIDEISEEPNMKSVPKKSADCNQINVIDLNTRKRVSKKDPCPCGSEKNYEKCCLG